MQMLEVNKMLTEERKQEILKYFSQDEVKLQLWLEEHEPADKMLWRKAWWNNNRFIRDDLLQKFFGYDYEIVGSHYSKSIECPVILVKYKGVDIILQYNFYDWQIMIKSEKPLTLVDLDLFNANGDYFYYQGIPHEYCFKKYSETNNKEFAIDIHAYDDYHDDVILFMYMLKKSIDNLER